MPQNYLTFLFLLSSFCGFAQTEKGVWSLKTNFQLSKLVPTDREINPQKYQWTFDLDLGLFSKDNNYFGVRVDYTPYEIIKDRFRRNIYKREISYQSFFRRYVGVKNLRGYFEFGGQIQSTIIKDSRDNRDGFNYFLLRKNRTRVYYY